MMMQFFWKGEARHLWKKKCDCIKKENFILPTYDDYYYYYYYYYYYI